MLPVWRNIYGCLWGVFVLTAALNILRVRAGFFTNHAADLAVPALLYVMTRGLAQRSGRTTRIQRWFGATAERAAVLIFLGSAATEWTQIFWPHGVFSGRFDPLDIVAFGAAIGLCYAGDKWSE